MGSNRRRFIKSSLLAGAAVTTPGMLTAGQQVETPGTNKNLNILVLGGTGYIGPHMVREALRRGHSITLFNRGRTNSQLFPDLETISELGGRFPHEDGVGLVRMKRQTSPESKLRVALRKRERLDGCARAYVEYLDPLIGRVRDVEALTIG